MKSFMLALALTLSFASASQAANTEYDCDLVINGVSQGDGFVATVGGGKFVRDFGDTRAYFDTIDGWVHLQVGLRHPSCADCLVGPRTWTGSKVDANMPSALHLGMTDDFDRKFLFCQKRH